MNTFQGLSSFEQVSDDKLVQISGGKKWWIGGVWGIVAGSAFEHLDQITKGFRKGYKKYRS